MIELEDLPELKDAVMIAAFEGWNDAGEAASAVIEHLAEIWDAEVVAALDPEDYYDFQVNRPRVLLENGRRRISWRTTRVLVATNTSLGRDVVLVQGVEPSFRWRAFAIELMELAQAADVSMVVTLGALMADVAHSRPIPVSATSDSEDTRHRHDLEMSSYEGPTGIVGVLADAATQVGVPSVSCWAAVPHYAGHSPSPKATLALVSRLEDLLDGPDRARRARRGLARVGARHQRAGGLRHRGRRVRREPRGGPGHRRPPRGQRRRHRQGVRALPATSRHGRG